MAISIQALRERHAALAKEVRALVEDHNGEWMPEHQEKYNAGMAEIDDLRAQIDRAQKVLDELADNAIDAAVVEAAARRTGGGRDAAAARAVFNRWLRHGDRAMSAEDWNTIRNTMSTTTPSQGGYTVATEVARAIADALKGLGGMREVATVIQTETGADMNFPTSDGTSEEGEIVAQNASANDSDPSFGNVLLPTFKYSSKVVTVPIELLQDSAVDIEAFVNNRLTQRVARITNKHFTVGAGTSEPVGVVGAATLGKVGTTGQTAKVIFGDLVDLYHSVDIAYRDLGRCRWMMHDSTLREIRKMADATTGRPLFLPGYDGLGVAMPDTVLGQPVTINNHVAAMAASAKSVLFGDFSFYVIRDVLNSYVYQRYDDSAYAKKGQVGFNLWARSGGAFTDVGGAVKYYQNSAT